MVIAPAARNFYYIRSYRIRSSCRKTSRDDGRPSNHNFPDRARENAKKRTSAYWLWVPKKRKIGFTLTATCKGKPARSAPRAKRAGIPFIDLNSRDDQAGREPHASRDARGVQPARPALRVRQPAHVLCWREFPRPRYPSFPPGARRDDEHC